MNISENVSLENHNSFGFPARARYFAGVTSVAELHEVLAFAREQQLPLIPLGGGSNLVLSQDLNAVVIAVNIMGCEVLNRDGERVQVRAGAGENWHGFVRWTLAENAFGLENLSLIPGNVGAAPIQNIGAYGVEISDYFESLEAVEIASGRQVTFTKEGCAFGYRDSIFKHAAKDRFVITSVTFNLDAVLSPRLSYGKLNDVLQRRCGSRQPEAFEISEAVSDIRMSKLPDPQVLGNAGSFFKNPVVDGTTCERLKAEFPDLVCFPSGEGWKLAAGWLIDRSGLRGYRIGSVGTYKHQALVLVNHGGAQASDLVELAVFIQNRVKETFGVNLEIEPRVY
ncbi:MAG: UDP-N-acetylmuramate dehydrogenase [Endozoicomonas sp.]